MDQDILLKLERLAKLKEQGALSESEFNEQKRTLIGNATPQPEPEPIVPVKPNKPSKWKIALYIFIGLFVLAALGNLNNKDQTQYAEVTPQEQARLDSLEVENERSRKLENDINIADLKADRAIKRILKDPDSYEQIDHRSAFVGEKGIYVSCLVTYRAKNSFGGFGVDRALVNFGEDMTPIEVIPVPEK
ncbi:MAG: SHOCT domain-containing protein [Spirosoma sp.]|nr:SHOCT domain-containing protein [Spirosoma sp.]